MDTVRRAARAAVAVVLAVALAGLAGCGFFKSEKAKVEDVVREGIKEKAGKTVDSLDLQPQGGGQYKGTATVAGEEWDVTATVSSTEIRWEARERITPEKIKQTATDLIKQQTGEEPKDLSLAVQPNGQYKGTATIGGVPHDVTARVEGTNVVCEWEPREK